mgnify:CR=1 FL=1
MKLMLRSKHGGRLEVIDADTGDKLDGVLGIELHAGPPDFSPQVRITMRPEVAVDVVTEIVTEIKPDEGILTAEGIRIPTPKDERSLRGHVPPRPLPSRADK